MRETTAEPKRIRTSKSSNCLIMSVSHDDRAGGGNSVMC